MEEKFCSISEALEGISETIAKFATEGPMKHISEEVRVKYLYEDTIGTNWDQNAFTQCYSNTFPRTFQQLYSALDSP